MKKLIMLMTALSLFTSAAVLGAEESSEKIRLVTLSKVEEVPASTSNFTGTAVVKPIFSKDSSRLSTGIVSFRAGARTAWHVHPRGQMLVILEGRGWTQQWNDKIVEFKKGDVVWIPAGVKHWHGAAADCDMSHLAIAPEDENQKSTDWFEKVSDRQYRK